MSEQQLPSMGRVVFVKLREKTEEGPEIIRSATITHVWNPTCVNLRINLDGDNDLKFIEVLHACRTSDGWMTSVTEGPGVRQWFWPPRV